MNQLIEKASVVFKLVEVNTDRYEVLKTRDTQLTLGAKYSEDLVKFYAKTHDNVLVLDAGVLAFKEPLKVGDYAKVSGEEYNGYSENGDIVIIKGVDDSSVPYGTEHLNGEYAGWHYTTDLVRATDEEVAEAKRKLAAETERKEIEAKWAKIGRKPNEIKVGDIVRRAPGYYDIVANVYGGNKLDMGEELVAPVEARFDNEGDSL